MSRAVTAEMADHRRDERKHEWRPGDPPSFDQRAAVAKLIGDCEVIVASGTLAAPAEQSLRVRIAAALSAFNMPSKAERAKETI